MKAIIISGMPASGKSSLARALSLKLGLKEIDGGKVMMGIAHERGYKTGGSDWWDTPDGIRFLRERERDLDIDREADRRMLQLVKDGNVVATSWTIPWLSKGCVCIWLDASREKRALRASKRDGVPVEESAKTIRLRDRENSDLYERLYGIKLDRDKKPFDIIVNTDDLDTEQVAEQVIKKLKELKYIVI